MQYSPLHASDHTGAVPFKAVADLPCSTHLSMPLTTLEQYYQVQSRVVQEELGGSAWYVSVFSRRTIALLLNCVTSAGQQMALLLLSAVCNQKVDPDTWIGIRNMEFLTPDNNPSVVIII